MIYKNLFFIFLLLTFSISVFAQPPGQVLGDLQLIYPKQDIFRVGDDINLHVHAYNSLNQLMNITSYDCYIHIYGIDGNHEVEDEMDDDSNWIDKEYTFNATYHEDTGYHSYNIFCNTSNEQGAVSEVFLFTYNGEEINDNWLPLLLVFITVMFGSFWLSNNIKASPKPKAKFSERIMLFMKMIYYYYGYAHFLFISIIALLMSLSKNISNYQDIFILYLGCNVLLAVMFIWYKSWELGQKSLEVTFSEFYKK